MSQAVAQTVAKWTRAKLAETGTKQRELGAHLGITQEEVSRKLAGKRGFTLAQLDSIAEFFDATPEEILR